MKVEKLEEIVKAKYAPDFLQAVDQAEYEAIVWKHNYIGTEHLVRGLARQPLPIWDRLTLLTGEELRRQVLSATTYIMGKGDIPVVGEPGLTPRGKRVIELAVDESRKVNSPEVGSNHLLIGLVREGEGIAWGVLDSLGIGLEVARTRVETARRSDSRKNTVVLSRLSNLLTDKAIPGEARHRLLLALEREAEQMELIRDLTQNNQP